MSGSIVGLALAQCPGRVRLGLARQRITRPVFPHERAVRLAKHCTHFHSLIQFAVGAGGVLVMHHKMLHRPLTLLVSVGGVLVLLWMVMGYEPRGGAEGIVPKQDIALTNHGS